MPEFVGQLGPWAWVVAGILLLGLELLAPGNFLLWFGIAALITAAVTFLTDLSWQVDALIFVALAVVLAVIGRRYFNAQVPSDQPYLNQRAMRYVGTTLVLDEPIVDGRGRVRIDDTQWRVEGPDLPSGARVRIVSADGAVLKVVAG